MRLGDEVRAPVEVIPTGSIALDVALGIGGLPRGRVVEIYGPEGSGKTSLALHAIANAQASGGIAAFIDAEHALDPDYAQKLGVDTDALLVSHEGIVLEAPTANVWWREGEHLLTPSLDLPILAGVTRGLVLELADHETIEGAFPLERVLAADEVFLCSSIREVMPVAAVDGHAYEVGRAARSLQEQLRAQALRS